MATIEDIFAEVVRLNEKLDALPGLIEVNGNQVIIGSLGELSNDLGLVKAGEFRSGNNHVPGDSFSGVRIGFPGFYYPSTSVTASDIYNIVGVDADTLQFGLRASDGVAVAGGGAVQLTDSGVFLAHGSAGANSLTWWDSDLGTLTSTNAMLGRVYIDNDGSTDLPSLPLWTFLATARGDSTIASLAASDKGLSGFHFAATFSGIDAGPQQAQTIFRLNAGLTTDALFSPSQGLVFLSHILTLSSGTTDTEDLNLYSMRISTDYSDFRWEYGISFGNTDASNIMSAEWFGLSTSIAFVRFDGPLNSVFFGGSDTSSLELGYLNEKALTFASTATAGIEDPDNEMGKLWLDTNIELRLTDTAGEDWLITKSTSTSNGFIQFLTATDSVTEVDVAAGWNQVPGSDTNIRLISGEITVAAGDIFRVEGVARIQNSAAVAPMAIGFAAQDTAGVLIQTPAIFVTAAADTDISNFVQWYFDTTQLTVATTYQFVLRDFNNSTADRVYLNDNRFLRVSKA